VSTTTTLSSKTYLSGPTTQIPLTTPSFDAQKISHTFDSTAESPVTIEDISIEEEYQTDQSSQVSIPDDEQFEWEDNFTATER